MTHYLEKDNLKALMEGCKSERLKEQLDVIDAFLGTEDHVTIEDMLDLLRKQGHNLEPMVVSQCMNRLVDLGFAQKKQFDGQPIRYEHRHLEGHHDHLVCTKCGKIAEFTDEDIERRQREVAARYGFHMLQHRMDIYGLCSDCLSKRQRLLPLSMAKPGERVVIREIAGGRTRRARLADMGLRPGDTVEVIANSGEGRMILAHGNTRLAMGRGIAQAIMVSLEGQASCDAT